MMNDGASAMGGAKQDRPDNAREFYDRFAGQYDAMTDFASRVESEQRALAPFVAEFGIRSAIDIGCGTGAHTIALARLGVSVTGLDVSPGMLEFAMQHAEGVPHVEFAAGDFLSPLMRRAPSVDAIFCLGNTLPHVASVEEAERILSYWVSCLGPEGIVVLQLLNYERLLSVRERIVGIRVLEDATIVRFYDFTEPRITFNILTIQRQGAEVRHTLQSTHLYPLTAGELCAVAGRAGFMSSELHADLSRRSYTADAKDCVLILRR